MRIRKDIAGEAKKIHIVVRKDHSSCWVSNGKYHELWGME